MPEVKDLGLANNEIVSVTRTSGTGQPGSVDTYTIAVRDGTTFTFNVTNGNNGLSGLSRQEFTNMAAFTTFLNSNKEKIACIVYRYLDGESINHYHNVVFGLGLDAFAVSTKILKYMDNSGNWQSITALSENNELFVYYFENAAGVAVVPTSRTIAGLGLESDITENALFDKMSIKGRYATLTALQTADPNHGYCYLVEENNHWYYWNGSAWADGGVYQAIANLSDSLGEARLDIENIQDTIYGKRTLTADDFVFKHIGGDGTLNNNDNKNLTNAPKVFAWKRSSVSVDNGYKFQVALYDKNTQAFIRRITWQTEEYYLDEDYYVCVEVSNTAESVLSDKSILEHLHLRLFKSSVNNDIDNIHNNLDSINENLDSVNQLSIGTFILKHIAEDGSLLNNNGKNASFEAAVVALKGSKVSVDSGYKYQIALYDKDTGVFVQRITWKYHGDDYIFANDYLTRLEISNVAESPLADTSISEHLHYTLYAVKQNVNEAILSNGFSVDNELKLNQNLENMFIVLGENIFVNKTYIVQKPKQYTAWPFVGVTNGRIVCAYTRGTRHGGSNDMAIYCKVSEDGVFWTTERKVIDNAGIRDTITGKGVDADGNLLLWNRVGGPDNPNRFEVYRTSDGISFEKISSISFENQIIGHIGDIVYVENKGLFCFTNNYKSTNAEWGVLKSTDGGESWTYTAIETGLDISLMPAEISPVYLGDGKILAMGRREKYADGGNGSMFQIQSSDYGQTFSKSDTNINQTIFDTPSVLLKDNTLYLYYFQRGYGTLRLRINSVSSIWNNPTNWSDYEIIGYGTTDHENTGNANATLFGDYQLASYYSGNSTDCGIYLTLKKFG